MPTTSKSGAWLTTLIKAKMKLALMVKWAPLLRLEAALTVLRAVAVAAAAVAVAAAKAVPPVPVPVPMARK